MPDCRCVCVCGTDSYEEDSVPSRWTADKALTDKNPESQDMKVDGSRSYMEQGIRTELPTHELLMPDPRSPLV